MEILLCLSTAVVNHKKRKQDPTEAYMEYEKTDQNHIVYCVFVQPVPCFHTLLFQVWRGTLRQNWTVSKKVGFLHRVNTFWGVCFRELGKSVTPEAPLGNFAWLALSAGGQLCSVKREYLHTHSTNTLPKCAIELQHGPKWAETREEYGKTDVQLIWLCPNDVNVYAMPV